MFDPLMSLCVLIFLWNWFSLVYTHHFRLFKTFTSTVIHCKQITIHWKSIKYTFDVCHFPETIELHCMRVYSVIFSSWQNERNNRVLTTWAFKTISYIFTRFCLHVFRIWFRLPYSNVCGAWKVFWYCSPKSSE